VHGRPDVADGAQRGQPLVVDGDGLGAGAPQPVDQEGQVLVPHDLGLVSSGRVVDDDPDPWSGDGDVPGGDLQPTQPRVGLPLLGDGTGVVASLAEVFGWAFAIWGIGLYWWAGVLYAWQVRRLLAETERRVVSPDA
jgi:hypothetical protein